MFLFRGERFCRVQRKLGSALHSELGSGAVKYSDFKVLEGPTSIKMARKKAVICGGGIMGCSTAFYLSQLLTREELEITLVECHEIAGHSSGKAGGFLAKNWGGSGAMGKMAEKSFEMHAELGKAFPNIGYRRVDTLNINKNRKKSKSEMPEWLDGKGLGCESMGTTDTTAQVHPELLTKALFNGAVDKGANFLKGSVEGVTFGPQDQVKGVMVDEEEIEADIVVIAMGPWSESSRSWFQKANIPRISGSRAHSIILGQAQNKCDDAVSAHALFLALDDIELEPEVYPRPDGTIYICGGGDQVPLPSRADEIVPNSRTCQSLKKVAVTLASSLAARDVIKEQACYLPYSGNGAPLIGQIKPYKGAYMATGHSCWGILNGPATGLAMAELIAHGKSTSVDITNMEP